MNLQVLTAAALGGVTAVFAARFVFRWLCGFSTRTPKDVVPFLRKIDVAAVYGAFHPEVEDEFRNKLSPESFKAWQWKRIHLAIHYCTDMPYNCWLFLGWARFERKENWNALPADLQKEIQDLRVACVRCRLASFGFRTRLRFYLLRMALLPFLRPPSFRALHRKGSSDIVNLYETVRILAESFSLAYGEKFHQEFLAAL